MKVRYISQENLKEYRGKTCLLRIDLNEEEGKECNSYRFRAILPTMKLLFENDTRILIASHRGRYGKNPLSLRPFREIIEKEMNVPVGFLNHVSEPGKISEIREKIVLLENLRLHKGEEGNSSKFAKKLASIADFYVNEAFPVLHRKNASVAQITRFLPSFGGLRLEKELENLDRAKKSPESPFTLILGGAKTSDKLGVLDNLWEKIDGLLLGGGPANTFLEAKGVDIGSSIKEKGMIRKIRKYAGSEKAHLPSDFKKEKGQILDIGENTLEEYSEIIGKSRTIAWNGPVGYFEKKEFSEGTREIWRAIIQNKDSHTVVGGGETVCSLMLLPEIKNYDLPENIFLSTGGGAMLAYLAGKKMPGLKALERS